MVSSKPLRMCFVGFRHGHVFSLYSLVKNRGDARIVGVCEEDAAVRAELGNKGVVVTHNSYDAMLSEVDCDAVAVGDYFGRRGAEVIQALEAGRHVIGDKPLCTRLPELTRIAELARANGLKVGCMLDLPDLAQFQTLRRLLASGVVGEAHTVCFLGQHPLLFGRRPDWYFESGKHGGTLNDLAIHAIDAIPWLTGQEVVEITAARAWNARHQSHPSFQDGAIVMLRLANGAGVIGDVSYLAPDGQGYSHPAYWRFTISGALGSIETSAVAKSVQVFAACDKAGRDEPLDPERPGGYFEDFLADIAGKPNPNGLRTERILHSSRVALVAQHAADTGVFPVASRRLLAAGG
ncbi:MAG: Gfo/Idh/MocA family oxidoreductase [Candidatus Hydrogenedentes bacterium]|nr:Gfo/Idh/MocA family oxidoreductase [Candidatus Hydrogenedentota bacterium]